MAFINVWSGEETLLIVVTSCCGEHVAKVAWPSCPLSSPAAPAAYDVGHRFSQHCSGDERSNISYSFIRHVRFSDDSRCGALKIRYLEQVSYQTGGAVSSPRSQPLRSQDETKMRF